ncbi:MAG: 4Fe-4S binding protein [Dehalococcoidia bacterium]|nr:4Fe-4S binding protein [Dehalococcoidia bacterium]
MAEIGSVVDVPIMGMSGITNWHDAVEYMMAGASVVQVGMAAMLFGYDMVRDMIAGMENFMAEKGYSQPQDFIGLSRRIVAGFGEHLSPLARTVSRRMLVDEEKCDGCGRCVVGCLATADGAVKVRRKIATVDHDTCIRCNVCRLVCPQHAIGVSDGDSLPELRNFT